MTCVLMSNCFVIATAVAVAGCAVAPAPTVVLDNPHARIEIRADEHLHLPHAHPATVTAETMRAFLSGIRIQQRADEFIGLTTGWSDSIPVFSPADVATMAVPLANALAQATPNQVVTFYRRVSDAAVGLAYTTGGFFVQDGMAYCIVANFRSLPSDTMLVGGVPGYLPDPITHPLLTIGRKFYRLSHQQSRAEVHLPKWAERYPEDKTLVVNLSLMRQESGPPASRTGP